MWLVLLGTISLGWASPVSSSKLAMVVVPAGHLSPFWIRPKTATAKPVGIDISTFQVMKYPVTNFQYIEFLKRHPEWRKSKVRRVFADGNYLAQFDRDLELQKGMSLQSAVTYVSWFAAKSFCEDQGLRLPTMAEWEYIAAADPTTRDASKDPKFLAQILEWYAQPQSPSGLPNVGARAANFYGIHDLHGLVWEWVDDFNSNLITGEGRTDGALDKNLFCGAGGMSGGDKENYAAFMRFAFRSSLKGAMTIWNLGFRCAGEVFH